MKEATGELNMTVVTVVAIAAIAAVFYAWVWPSIKISIAKNTCDTQCGKGSYQSITRSMLDNEDQENICRCTSSGS